MLPTYPLPHPVLSRFRRIRGKDSCSPISFSFGNSGRSGRFRRKPSFMKYTDLNRHGGIGANCSLLEIGPFRIAIDSDYIQNLPVRILFPVMTFWKEILWILSFLLIVTWIIWEVFLFSRVSTPMHLFC